MQCLCVWKPGELRNEPIIKLTNTSSCEDCYNSQNYGLEITKVNDMEMYHNLFNYIMCTKSVYIYYWWMITFETPKVIAKYELSRYPDLHLNYQPQQDKMEMKKQLI